MTQKAIAIYSPKGGVGKSTLTFHLADALFHKRGLSVRIIDRDKQGSIRSFQRRTEEVGRPVPFALTSGIPDEMPMEDVVLIDHAPLIGAEFVPPEGVDLVIVPVRPSFVDFESLIQFKNVLEEKGFNTLFVLNSLRANVASHQEVAKDPFTQGWATIKERNVFDTAIASGQGLFCMPSSEAVREARNDILLVVDEIERRLGRFEKQPTPSTLTA